MTTGLDAEDARFLAVRHAGQDATDFHLPDAAVRRFLELRDAGAAPEAIAAELGLEPEVVAELVRADEAQAVAHRIATGQLPMYPAPAPEDRVYDGRLGSERVPLLALALALAAVAVYVVAR